MENNNKKNGQRVEIMMSDEEAVGAYVNLALVNHSADEFTLDFIYVPPGSPKAKLRSRIISSPAHTKRILMALQDNVRRYEERFGTIDTARPLDQSGGQGTGHGHA